MPAEKKPTPETKPPAKEPADVEEESVKNPPELNRDQLEDLRRKLHKKFH